jgi:hypothetical protein
VLNGRTEGDSQGEFTFISHLGKIVIDYVIASSALFNSVIDFRVLECDISHHFPCSAFVRSSTALKEPSVYNRVVYRWNDKCSDDFVEVLCSIAYHVGESMRVYSTGVKLWVNRNGGTIHVIELKC